MKKELFTINKKNILLWIGIGLSLVWLCFATNHYFEILMYTEPYEGRYYVGHLKKNFSWETKYIKQDNNPRFFKIHQTPSFSLAGYLDFILLPLLIGWLFFALILYLIQSTLAIEVYNLISCADFSFKILIATISTFFALLLFNDGNLSEVIFCMSLILGVIPIIFIALRYLKALVYEIVFSFVKAIEDVRRK